MLSLVHWAATRAANTPEPTPTMRYLTRLKDGKGLVNDSQLAEHLGEYRMTVRRWTTGQAVLPDATGRIVAAALGLPAEQVLAELAQERDERRKRRRARAVTGRVERSTRSVLAQDA